MFTEPTLIKKPHFGNITIRNQYCKWRLLGMLPHAWCRAHALTTQGPWRGRETSVFETTKVNLRIKTSRLGVGQNTREFPQNSEPRQFGCRPAEVKNWTKYNNCIYSFGIVLIHRTELKTNGWHFWSRDHPFIWGADQIGMTFDLLLHGICITFDQVIKFHICNYNFTVSKCHTRINSNKI